MRVLLVSHGYPPAAYGGTEIYTRALARALARAGCAVTVLTRSADRMRPEYCVTHDADGPVAVIRINNTFQACRTFEESYANPELARVAAAEIARAAPDVAHIQHLTCLSTRLPAVIAACDVPIVMTLNDYWLVCHRGQLFDAGGQRCDGPSESGCARCVPRGALASPWAYRAGRLARASRTPGLGLLARVGARAIELTSATADVRAASRSRLEHMRRAVEPIDLFLAPSQTLEERFTRFGMAPGRLRRCKQGIDLQRFPRAERVPSATLRVGFAGGLMRSKGAHVLLAAVARLPHGRVTVDILGSADAPAHESHADALVRLLSRPFVRKTGPVPHDRMADALASVDVLAVPSLWLENAPFVIREAFASGAPVVASNVGGMAEMVRDGVDGLLVEPGDVSGFAAALDRLATDAALLARLRAGIRPPLSIDEDAASLVETYASILRPRARAVPVSQATAAPRVAAVVLNYHTPDQTWLAVRSLQTSTRPPDSIHVVDNGSADGSFDFLRARLEGVDVTTTGENLGFSGGCNVGLRRALAGGADLVLLANSDVVLHPCALATLVEAAASHPDAGAFGPVIVSREEPDRIASAGIAFDTASGRMRQRAAGLTLSLLLPSHPHAVDALSGAALMIRGAALDAVGLLDEAYFFYFEDVEFCLRAARGGFASICVPAALAYHEGARSVGRRSPRRAYFATRNHLRLAAHVGRGSRVAAAARAAFVLGLNAAHASLSPEVPLGSGLRAVLRGARDHFRGRYGSD